jgi:hypothetical protein
MLKRATSIPKNKITTKWISKKEFLDSVEDRKRKKAHIESFRQHDIEVKHGIDMLGATAHSIPVPTHVLKSRISKKDQYTIHQMVAMIENKYKARLAKTIRFILKRDKNHKDVQTILKNTGHVIETGEADELALDALWKRSKTQKLAKHELFLERYSSKKKKKNGGKS